MKKLIPLLLSVLILLTGCGFAGETYRHYVTAMLDCTYHNECDEYVELTENVTMPDASGIFMSEAQNLSQRIRDTYGIKSDLISVETLNAYTKLAETVLQKTKYTVRDVLFAEDTYTIVFVISPVDFWEISKEPVQKYYQGEFTRKYKKAPTKKDADKLEEEYARKVLEILTDCAENISYLEPVVYTAPIEHYTISPQDWQKIDNLILNLE